MTPQELREAAEKAQEKRTAERREYVLRALRSWGVEGPGWTIETSGGVVVLATEERPDAKLYLTAPITLSSPDRPHIQSVDKQGFLDVVDGPEDVISLLSIAANPPVEEQPSRWIDRLVTKVFGRKP